MSAAGSSLDHMPTVYAIADRPSGYVLRDGTWHACIVRMIHDDGRLNIQWTQDGANYLDAVPASAVRLDE